MILGELSTFEKQTAAELRGERDAEAARLLAEVATQCASRAPQDRPTAWAVLVRLQRFLGDETGISTGPAESEGAAGPGARGTVTEAARPVGVGTACNPAQPSHPPRHLGDRRGAPTVSWELNSKL